MSSFHKSLFLSPPSDHHPSLDVVAAFIECEQKFLFLKRHPNKPEGRTWCLPGGKAQPNESLKQALVREVFEETHILLCSSNLLDCGTLYARDPFNDFRFHLFYIAITAPVDVKISTEESEDFQWLELEQSLAYPLISGAKEIIQLIYGKDLQSFKPLKSSNITYAGSWPLS